MRWAGHVACMGRGEMYTWLWWGKPRGKRSLGKPRRRWRIILGFIFRKRDGGY